MAKKKKRKLKKWVRLTISGIILAFAAWLLCWPAKTLCDYWQKDMESNTATNNRKNSKRSKSVYAEPDSVIIRRVRRFVTSPTRLDTADIALSIWDLSSGTPVLQWHDDDLMVPASSLKLLTAISALKRLGCNHQYTERVMIRGSIRNGVLDGDAIFQADDNPMIESLDEYINALGSAGIRKINGRFILNLMRTDTLRAHHTASFWDIPYNRTPILLKGSPRIANEISSLLRRKGIESPRPVVERGIKIYPVSKVLLCKNTSMTDVIAPMLIHSSNIKADALYHHVESHGERYKKGIGKRTSQLDIFLQENLKYDTSDFTLNDGSGLSPENMVNADFLLALLRYGWEEPEIRDILINEALATPGHPTRRGSLLSRMSGPVFHNRIFCKTGTLTSIGASSLCGYAHGRNGHWYAFAIINRDSPVAESRLYQDMLCKVLVK